MSERHGGLAPYSELTEKRRSTLRQKKDSIISIEPIATSITGRPSQKWSVGELRRSISDLNIAGKVKSMIGKKRAREEDQEEVDRLERERPSRKAPALTSDFWQKYRDLYVYHHEFEAMAAAMVISHTYDEANGLHMLREPSHCHVKTLAALEGQERSVSSSTYSSFCWSEHEEDIHMGSTWRSVSDEADLEGDLSWAGQEIEDFKCYVRTASSSDWGSRMSQALTTEHDCTLSSTSLFGCASEQ